MRAKKVTLILSLICVFSLLAVSSAFAEEDWKLSASATFESGTYGTGTTTENLYVPVMLKRYFDTGDISVTVPYVMLRSNESVEKVDFEKTLSRYSILITSAVQIIVAFGGCLRSRASF